MTTDSLDFDADGSSLTLTTVPVRYQGKNFLLVEALGDAVAQWRNAQMQGTTLRQSDDDSTKTIALGGLADSEPILVSLCLFEPDKEGNLILDPRGNVDTRRRVPLSVVRCWPNRVVSRLFERAKAISGLDEVETAASLQKKIVDMQGRLNKLARSGNSEEGEQQVKN